MATESGERAASPEQPSLPEQKSGPIALGEPIGESPKEPPRRIWLFNLPQMTDGGWQWPIHANHSENTFEYVRAGAARPGAADDPEHQDVLSAADHLMEYADHISGPTDRLAVVQLAKRLRGALSGGAADPTE